MREQCAKCPPAPRAESGVKANGSSTRRVIDDERSARKISLTLPNSTGPLRCRGPQIALEGLL